AAPAGGARALVGEARGEHVGHDRVHGGGAAEVGDRDGVRQIGVAAAAAAAAALADGDLGGRRLDDVQVGELDVDQRRVRAVDGEAVLVSRGRRGGDGDVGR